MNYFTTIFIAVFAFSGYFASAKTFSASNTEMALLGSQAKAIEEAELANGHISKPRQCARQLEGIIYSPSSCVSDYLERIATQMKINLNVIMTELGMANLNYLTGLSLQYGLGIFIGTSFGAPVQVVGPLIAQGGEQMNQAITRTYLGLDGFNYDSGVEMYYYYFSLMSDDATLLYFVLALPAAQKPACC